MPEPRTFKKLSLDNIAQGAVIDLFNYEWDRIMQDVADTTKQAKAVRSLNITLKVKPTEDRGGGDIEVDVSSKLAKSKPTKGTVYLGTEGDRVVSFVNDPKETDLFEQEPEEVSSER